MSKRVNIYLDDSDAEIWDSMPKGKRSKIVIDAIRKMGPQLWLENKTPDPLASIVNQCVPSGN